MKKLATLVLATLLLLSVLACGGNGAETNEPMPEPTGAAADPSVQAPTPEPTAEPTPEPTPEPEPKFSVGETVSTDIMELTLDESEPAIALSNSWGLSGSEDWGKTVYTPKEYDAAADADNPYVAAKGHTLIYFCITASNLDRARLEYVTSSSDLKYRFTIEYNGSTEAELKYGAMRSNQESYVSSSSGRITTILPNQWYQSTIMWLEVGETATARLYFDIPTDVENLTEGYTLSFALPNSDGTETTFSYYVPAK